MLCPQFSSRKVARYLLHRRGKCRRNRQEQDCDRYRRREDNRNKAKKPPNMLASLRAFREASLPPLTNVHFSCCKPTLMQRPGSSGAIRRFPGDNRVNNNAIPQSNPKFSSVRPDHTADQLLVQSPDLHIASPARRARRLRAEAPRREVADNHVGPPIIRKHACGDHHKRSILALLHVQSRKIIESDRTSVIWRTLPSSQ